LLVLSICRLMYNKHSSPIEHPASSSSLPGLQDYPAALPSVTHKVVHLEPEEDVKPPPELPALPPHAGPEVVRDQEQHSVEQHSVDHTDAQELASVQEYEPSLSPALSTSSVNIPLSISPLADPHHDLYPNDLYPHDHLEQERFRTLHFAKEEHELVLANHRKVAVYLEEKREGLKRKQELEEELLRAKIKVEKLRAAQLRHGLPLPL